MKKVRAFTLIELLVVILILGILLAIAIPAYLSSVKDGRMRTASSNAKAIATAVQSLYVKNGGTSYADYGSATTALVTEMAGTIPNNPCTGANAFGADYTVAATTTSFSITPNAGSNCDTMTAVTLTGG
jgi:type IV pilus assembly protein PilA